MTDTAAASAQNLVTLRRLLDAIGGVPYNLTEAGQAAALAELTGLLLRTGLHKTVLEMLVSGALFHIRSLQNSEFVPQIIQQVKTASPKAALEDIDAAAFFPERAGKTLEKLTDIPEDLLLLFKQAAPQVLAGLSVEELTVLLLSTTTPDWLVRIILIDRRLLNIFGQNVCPPYGWRSLPADGLSDEQKEAELDKVTEQARKALDWVNKCPEEYFPVNIDPCPLDAQGCAVGRLAKELDKAPADKLLTIISLNLLPAWLRKAAERKFSELAAKSKER
jgi:hypothetical protein